MAKYKELEQLVARARELAEKKDRSPEEASELETVMGNAKTLRDGIVRDRTIDEFTKTISDQVAPVKEPRPSDEVYLGRMSPGSPFKAYVERKGFADAVEKWKAKRLDTHWGFDLRFKTDVDGAAAETNASALDFVGDTAGEQYGGVVQPFYYPGIIEPPTRTPLIGDLFAAAPTSSNLVRLVRETFTSANAAGYSTGHGAKASGEGAPYGTVKLEVGPQDWPVRDITALLPVTEDILSDIPAMSAYLSMRLAKFVQLTEEEELVNGDGTGFHLDGILNADNVTPASQGSDDIDTAVMKLNAAVYAASFMDPEWVAMSPTTWATYVTLRTDLNGGQGQFLAGPPTLAAVRNMWGLPITVSPAIPDENVVVGSRAAGMIFRNGGLRVESSTGYGTFFGEGLVAIRAKVRTAFALIRPQAIGVLTLGS